MFSISAPGLSVKQIREKAEEFRKMYAANQLPFPIVEIMEFDLKILPDPVPNMLSKIDVDGFLSTDLKTIYVDQDCYYDERYENRLRFTFAHELGHLILHKEIISNCEFRNEGEWRNFQKKKMSSYDYSTIEYQANEFAGRLLVPKDSLITEIQKLSDKIKTYYKVGAENDTHLLISYISEIICKKFQVSNKVIEIRIDREKIDIHKECGII